MINFTLAIITVISLIVAAIMTLVAWTMTREERRRAAARVAVLSAAIHEHNEPLRLAPADGRGGLFTEAPPQQGTRLAAAGVVGLLAVGAVTGLVLLAEGGSRRRPASGPVHVERQAVDVPLELIALEHDRDETRLVVRGIVRNPPSGAKLNGLTAVVLVFSKDGAFVADERAPVAIAPLAAGAETPFVVTLPDADSVDRYRVSFRTDDRIVPHVDRRGRNPVAHTE